jgi:hypothetical protein
LAAFSSNAIVLTINLWQVSAMSSDYMKNPKHWLDRAAEMRAIAATMAEDGIKASVLRMATDYDKLAARAIARGAEGAPSG